MVSNCLRSGNNSATKERSELMCEEDEQVLKQLENLHQLEIKLDKQFSSNRNWHEISQHGNIGEGNIPLRRLVSALAYSIGEEGPLLTFLQADVDFENGRIKNCRNLTALVFTDTYVAVGRVNSPFSEEEKPIVTIVNRHSIQSLSLTPMYPAILDPNEKETFQSFNVTLKYAGIDGPVVIGDIEDDPLIGYSEKEYLCKTAQLISLVSSDLALTK